MFLEHLIYPEGIRSSTYALCFRPSSSTAGSFLKHITSIQWQTSSLSLLHRLCATLLKQAGLFECQPHTRLCPLIQSAYPRLEFSTQSIFHSVPESPPRWLLHPPLSHPLPPFFALAAEANIVLTKKEGRGGDERGLLQSLMGLAMDRGSAFKTRRQAETDFQRFRQWRKNQSIDLRVFTVRGVHRLIKRELFFSVFDPNQLDGDKKRDKLKTVNF